MKKHLLCLTVDTDPDGLSGKVTNREALRWDGLEYLQRVLDNIVGESDFGRIPLTWFLRADGQLENILGTPLYLLEKYGSFWPSVEAAGHEIGWHPHLYLQRHPDDPVVLIKDPQAAQDEIERLWSQLRVHLRATAFRNGEGWHSPETYATVERLGFLCDSTAIPGRSGTGGHPMNWNGAPNQPYYPASENLCSSGAPRPMLELPMNTWLLQAPYESAPRVRYMNPAVRSNLFAKALVSWENACKASAADLSVWVMIFHPDEVSMSQNADALYSRSIDELCANLHAVVESLQRLEHEFEWVTVSEAAENWRNHQHSMIA